MTVRVCVAASEASPIPVNVTALPAPSVIETTPPPVAVQSPLAVLTMLPSVVFITMLINVLKVFDIIWIMTQGGPVNASTTFAIWSYRLGFGGESPDLSPAAAVGNLLIVIAFVFGLIYIRLQQRMARS